MKQHFKDATHGCHGSHSLTAIILPFSSSLQQSLLSPITPISLTDHCPLFDHPSLTPPDVPSLILIPLPASFWSPCPLYHLVLLGSCWGLLECVFGVIFLLKGEPTPVWPINLYSCQEFNLMNAGVQLSIHSTIYHEHILCSVSRVAAPSNKESTLNLRAAQTCCSEPGFVHPKPPHMALPCHT